MLLHYVIDENRRHGLKDLAGLFFPEMKNYDAGLRAALKIKDLDEESFGNVPLEILGPYCAMDCETTFRLGKKLIPNLTPKLKRVFFSLYMPLSKVYTEAELLGVKVDIPYVKKILKENEKKLVKLTEKIFKIAGRELNLNSPKQLIELLFIQLNFPIILKTASGKASTSEGALKALKSKRLPNKEIIDWILEYRSLKKMSSTYLGPMVDLVDEDDRVHPSFLLHGTVTGRVSSKGPNIQNIPRDPRIKGMFIPEKDYHFVEMDFSQAELRVMAYYSKDKVMTTQYKNEEDIHLSTACFIFKTKPEDISKRQRKIAKLVNFGYLYGATAKKAHQSIGEKLGEGEKNITLNEAKQFRNGFFTQYAGIDRFIRQIRGLVKKEKQIESCFGRIRRLPQIDSPYEEKQAEAMRQGLNALIQGTASDLTQLALIKIHKFLLPYKTRFLFTVHDAILFEVHVSELHLLPKLKDIMEERRKPFNFPIIADIDHYKRRWGND
jgi:DNA polymerase-1